VAADERKIAGLKFVAAIAAIAGNSGNSGKTSSSDSATSTGAARKQSDQPSLSESRIVSGRGEKVGDKNSSWTKADEGCLSAWNPETAPPALAPAPSRKGGL
jgi:hypothetical protein